MSLRLALLGCNSQLGAPTYAQQTFWRSTECCWAEMNIWISLIMNLGVILVKIHWFDNLPIKPIGSRNHTSLFSETKNFGVENMFCKVCLCASDLPNVIIIPSHRILVWTHRTVRWDFRNEDKSSFQRWLSRHYLLLSSKAWSDIILPLCTQRDSAFLFLLGRNYKIIAVFKPWLSLLCSSLTALKSTFYLLSPPSPAPNLEFVTSIFLLV